MRIALRFERIALHCECRLRCMAVRYSKRRAVLVGLFLSELDLHPRRTEALEIPDAISVPPIAQAVV
eukprot:1330772-Rhodomonas_salina.1